MTRFHGFDYHELMLLLDACDTLNPDAGEPEDERDGLRREILTAMDRIRQSKRVAAVSFGDALQEARDLLEPGEEKLNPEYLRALCELIARCFPEYEVPTPERADDIEAELLAMTPR